MQGSSVARRLAATATATATSSRPSAGGLLPETLFRLRGGCRRSRMLLGSSLPSSLFRSVGERRGWDGGAEGGGGSDGGGDGCTLMVTSVIGMPESSCIGLGSQYGAVFVSLPWRTWEMPRSVNMRGGKSRSDVLIYQDE